MSDRVRVLYIDDNPHDRQLVRDALEKEHGGFAVTEAASREVFERELEHGGWDLVLSDFNILGYDGLDVIQAVSTKYPDLPVVIVTGTGSEELAVESIKQGAADYVIKTPSHIQHLPVTLHGVLEHRAAKRRQNATEEALRLSEERLRLILDAAKAGIYDFDVESGDATFSDRWYTMIGYQPGELPPRFESLRRHIHPEDLGRAEETMWKSIEEGTPFNIAFRSRHKDGRWRWIRSRGQTIEWSVEGQPKRVVGSHIDITPQREAEDALKESRADLRHLVESSADGILVVDRSRHVVFSNSAAETLLGIEEGDSAIREFAYPLVENMLGEIEVPSSLDSIRTLETRTVRSKWEGQPVHIVSLRDISQRISQEEDRRRLMLAIDQAAEWIMIADRDGHIQYVNPAFEAMSGYKAEEVIGQKPNLLKSARHGPEFYHNLWSRLIAGNTWHGCITNQRKDGGDYQLEGAISPFVDSSGEMTGFVAVMRDVTEEHAMERRINQAQRLEAIGTLAGGIAHDFNNILSAIVGYTYIALHDLPENSPIRDDLQHVVVGAERAKELVYQILTFSRKVEQARTPIRVQSVLKEALKLLRPTLPSTIDIREEIDDECGYVIADGTQLHQIIVNLCTNAYQAMRESGGLLEVRLQPYDVHAGMDQFQGRLQPGPYVHLTVSDTGCGMDPATLDRVFEPFFTTKRPGEGSGMGLATVHGIVASHGGLITSYSELGVGTSFHVYLPSAEPDEQVQTEEVEIVSGGTENILVIDDEPALVNAFSRSLENYGYQVTGTTDSAEAVRVFTKNPNVFDLVITDQTMPSLTGTAVANEIHEIRQDIPIILTTGFSDVVTREQALDFGFADYVMKPVTPPTLAAVVRAALDRGKQDPGSTS